MKNPESGLPPGFRFHPTDEELIFHYLRNKVASAPLPVSVISEVDIYKFDPWDLPDKAAFGEKEWYFFSPRDRKYPNGARPNRAAASGYWKATGTDKNIVASPTRTAGGGDVNIGVKKALVFYKGRPPKGIKTNWIMHEYRLAQAFTHKRTNNSSSMRLDDWVLCRIYKKSNVLPSSTAATSDQEQEEDHLIQETTLPHNTLMPQKSSSFSNLLDAIDYSMLRNFLSDSHCNLTGFESAPMVSLEQPFLNNCTNIMSSNSSLPQLCSPVSLTENCLKRQHSNLNEDVFCPSKKLVNSYNFSNSTTQSNVPQFNNFSNKSFLNRQFTLSPHLQFQG